MKWGRRHKYNAVATVVDGIRFPSKTEARHYCALKALQDRGEISDLKRQVRFPLVVNGELICTYVADFTYREPGKALRIADDAKGYETAEFKLKAKLFRALERDHELRISKKPAKVRPMKAIRKAA